MPPAGIEDEISSIIKDIMSMKNANQFRPYINYVQFPRYRNFEADLRITFPFPLTVIIGQNGTGKSSLLQALSGAPKSTSPGSWWFGTALDPTEDETPGRRNLAESHKAALWYEYIDTSGIKRYTLKTRIKRAGDPDYWEPSKPVVSYGMPEKRRSLPVEMTARYLNFKTQINAFDKCFYFSADNQQLIKAVAKSHQWQSQQDKLPMHRKRAPRIQDYLRTRAKKLRRVLVDRKTIKCGKHQMHKPLVALTPSQIADLSRIIGRQYRSGAILEHRFYESWATSVLFELDTIKYSEAFAGSGESAVARLVHQISNADDGTLFLLDEPETSLHPGAQHELVRYLLDNIKRKKLQIVISTHSPAIVRYLPPEAIRVFSIESNTSVRVTENIRPNEAFHVIGHPTENKIRIITEDALSSKLLEAVLATIGTAFASQFTVTYRAGGDTGMKSDAALFMLDQSDRTFYVFDGDKKNTCGPICEESISVLASTADIDRIIRTGVGVGISYRQNSNMNDSDKRDIRLKYIRYINRRFLALPFDTPEDAIWNEDIAKKMLRLVAPDYATLDFSHIDAKERFKRLTAALIPTGSSAAAQIETIHQLFITRFCESQDSGYDAVADLLKEIASRD